jgi:hypothetical protein
MIIDIIKRKRFNKKEKDNLHMMNNLIIDLLIKLILILILILIK